MARSVAMLTAPPIRTHRRRAKPRFAGCRGGAPSCQCKYLFGRCAEVCPVKIPLPKIMRYWRTREYNIGAAPKSIVFGLSLWAFAARRPWLYRIAARTASRLLQSRAGATGLVKSLPIMRGWFAVRDLPAPQGKTFRDLWRAKQMNARGEILFAVRAGLAQTWGRGRYRIIHCTARTGCPQSQDDRG